MIEIQYIIITKIGNNWCNWGLAYYSKTSVSLLPVEVRIFTIFTRRENLLFLYSPKILLKKTMSRVLLHKLTGPLLVKKSPSLYGNRRFITVFTRARHCSISSDQSSPYPHPTSSRTILILCNIFLCPIHATCLAHFILIDLITRSIWWWIQIIKILLLQSSLLHCLFPLRPECHHPILENPQPVFLSRCLTKFNTYTNRQNYSSLYF